MIVEPMVQRGLPRKDSINPLSKKQNLGILTFYKVRLFNDEGHCFMFRMMIMNIMPSS